VNSEIVLVATEATGRALRPVGSTVELHRTQSGIDAVDLIADPARLLLGDAVQREDRVGGLLGDETRKPD
jgi:hypothetical protein